MEARLISHVGKVLAPLFAKKLKFETLQIGGWLARQKEEPHIRPYEKSFSGHR